MYDDKIIEVFLREQTKFYSEPVAQTAEEAREFLEETMAAIADSKQDVADYLADVGVDIDGLTLDEILEMPEVFAVGDGRYLLLEI